MSNKQMGNNLLYLLSEKTSLKWNQFKGYAEELHRQNESARYKSQKVSYSTSYDFWEAARNLSSMAYIDMGRKTGETMVKINPPILAELPFFQLIFLLTGARSPELLETIKQSIKSHSIDIEIKTHNQFPDTLLIKPENKETLQVWLKNTKFQGNKLSDYITISKSPPAWNILEFAGSLAAYEQALIDHWCSGNKEDINSIFDTDSLKFKPFNPDKDNLANSLSLVKICYQEGFYTYYLFLKEKEDRVEVLLDWGRFLMAKQSKRPVLEYNKKTFELSSSLRLPYIFERGLVLLSGQPPVKPKKALNKAKNQKNNKKLFTFINVPHKIAVLVSKKLEQNLKEI